MLAAAERWRTRLARQPTLFLHGEQPRLVRAAAEVLAARLGVPGDTLAFVANATEAINAVLRSRRFAAEDEILILDQAYGAVRKTASFVAARSGARIVVVAIPFPDVDPDRLVRRVEAAVTARTRIAILDHVTSPGALVLPVAAMVRACRSRDVPVLVDGAHAPGQLPLDLGAIGADWYAGTLHKWWFAPTGVGFLQSRPDAQEGLHPTSISHGLGDGFAAEFDWTGTRDPAPVLAVPDAIAFADAIGGPALLVRNACLVREGASRIADRLATDTAPPCLTGSAMALTRLPAAAGAPTTDAALRFRAALIRRRLDTPVVALAGHLWLRSSAQAYNAIEDWERAADVVTEAIRDLG